jgi:hypothetical protein
MTNLERAKEALQRSEDSHKGAYVPHVYRREMVEVRNAMRSLIMEMEGQRATIERLQARSTPRDPFIG